MSSSIARLFIDTDVGTDDIFAITMLLQLHMLQKIVIIGISTVNGVMPAKEGAVVIKRLLKTLSIEDIPVGIGHEGRFIEDQGHYFHEADWWPTYKDSIMNVADLLGLNNQTEPLDLSGDVSEFIVHATSRSDSPLTLLALGPLTNIAQAVHRNQNFLDRFQSIVMMGGALLVPGNAPNHVAEWNFYADAPAADSVFRHLNSSRVSCTVVGLEVANEHVIPRERQFHLGESPTHPTSLLLKKLIHINNFTCSFDPVAATCWTHRELFQLERFRISTAAAGIEEGRLKMGEDDEQATPLWYATALDKEAYYQHLNTIMSL